MLTALTVALCFIMIVTSTPPCCRYCHCHLSQFYFGLANSWHLSILELPRISSFSCINSKRQFVWMKPKLFRRFELFHYYRTRVRSLAMLVTNWLTDWLTDWLLFSEADVSDEDCVGNSLLQFWSWGLDIKLNFCSDFEHKFGQDFEVEVKGRFEAGVWSVVFCWCIVEVIKLNLGRDSEAWFGQYF